MSNEPVAWRYWHSSGGRTESEYVYNGREFPARRNSLREPVPLYSQDDTALLRQALEALEDYEPNEARKVCNALRERLKEST